VAIESVNPATGDVIRKFEELSDDQIEHTIQSSVNAFSEQRASSFTAREERMNAAAVILDDEKTTLARIATEEMGKTLAAAVAEVEKCAWVCRFYAAQARAFLADEPIETDAARSFVRHLPIGPVLAVMPWNFPYWQVFRFAAPALMAGNVGLLKHASNVPRCALAIEDIFSRAGFPRGSFSTLLIGSSKVERVLKDVRVRAATLTGSEAAGRAVAGTAGKEIKHTVLELGGSDPFIVMPSADLGGAIRAAVKGRTINNGQSCIAAKRFIVHERVYDAFATGFVAAMASLTVGDPMDAATDVGPLATKAIRDELDEQVRRTLETGATRLTGAEIMDGPGYFYRPGVLADIPENSPAYTEEIFGPVATLFKVRDLDHAIELGNATDFGLGSAIWTTDEAEIGRAIDELDAGSTFVNDIVASDPRLPFGGVKRSGYGRELAQDGIREFVNRKTISVAAT
jgi:succinate-semialdehyde dehydrogenase/glutarate-semialdehyde dehydrogenase